MINKLFLLVFFPGKLSYCPFFIPKIQMTAKYRKTHSKGESDDWCWVDLAPDLAEACMDAGVDTRLVLLSTAHH